MAGRNSARRLYRMAGRIKGGDYSNAEIAQLDELLDLFDGWVERRRPRDNGESHCVATRSSRK